MTDSKRFGSAIAVAVTVFAPGLSACGDDEPECVGDGSGDVIVSQGLDQRLDAGGDVGMGSADPGGDPPWVSLGITSATADNRDAARHLELGGSFTVAGTTYTLAGFCDDEAYLNVQ